MIVYFFSDKNATHCGVKLVNNDYKQDVLKATRGAHRGVISKLEKQANESLAQAQEGSAKIHLHVICFSLENKLKTSSEIYDQINSLFQVEIPIIMSRLPCDAQFHIAPRNMKEVWKINKLLSIIKSENNSQELSAGTRSSGSESLKPPSSN